MRMIERTSKRIDGHTVEAASIRSDLSERSWKCFVDGMPLRAKRRGTQLFGSIRKFSTATAAIAAGVAKLKGDK
jgi:hypothetical protein